MNDFVDQSKVFFRCAVCEFEFQADPDFIPIKCPQCGSEDNYRV
jgi:predicted Zn-ribbon and HTH transcriptional regulator